MRLFAFLQMAALPATQCQSHCPPGGGGGDGRDVSQRYHHQGAGRGDCEQAHGPVKGASLHRAGAGAGKVGRAGGVMCRRVERAARTTGQTIRHGRQAWLTLRHSKCATSVWAGTTAVSCVRPLSLTCPAALSSGTPVASSRASMPTVAAITPLLYTSPNWSSQVRSCGRLACWDGHVGRGGKGRWAGGRGGQAS
jgi:hypothetical protein